MRKFFCLCLCFVFAGMAQAQIQDPVNCTFSAKKINATTYEVHLTAEISGKWHLYSQTTPDGGPVATEISFAKNPLITVEGKAKEVGKLQTKHEPLFGVDVKQFGGKVDFVQLVKLKSPVKTTVSGTIEFMVCDDTQCLPPATEKFSIQLK